MELALALPRSGSIHGLRRFNSSSAHFEGDLIQELTIYAFELEYMVAGPWLPLYVCAGAYFFAIEKPVDLRLARLQPQQLALRWYVRVQC